MFFRLVSVKFEGVVGVEIGVVDVVKLVLEL